MKKKNDWLKKIEQGEDFLLLFLLGLMLVFILSQFFLRNIFSSGWKGGDTFIRHLLLWVVFISAGLTSRENAHIKIDLVTNFFPSQWKIFFQMATNFFSGLVSGCLVYIACLFVYTEYQIQETISFYNCPVWLVSLIFPLGYTLITLRFTRNLFLTVLDFFKGAKN